MSLQQLFVVTGIVVLTLVTSLWLLSLRLKNASIIDIFWGIGFTIIAWLAFALAPQGFLPRKLLLVVLVTTWGLRLARRAWLSLVVVISTPGYPPAGSLNLVDQHAGHSRHDVRLSGHLYAP